VTEVLQLQPFIEEWRQLGFEVLLVASDDPRELTAFLETNHLRVTVLLDRKGEAGKAYRVRGIPLTVFVDREGIVRANKLGWGEGSLREFQDWVAKLA
jgi:peroxiredoxin